MYEQKSIVIIATIGNGMSSFVKARLKASRDAIQAKDWDSASESASEVLENDSTNYNALVFKALALFNLKKLEESENLYRKAINLQPNQALAWQGLEKALTESKQWDKLIPYLKELMDQDVKSDDSIKCAEHLQKLVEVQREHGSSSQLAETLSFYLPSSPYFSTLSSLSAPDQTNPTATTTFDAQMAIHVHSLKVLLEIIQLTEENEGRSIEREVTKRKTRLDSMSKGMEAVRNEIGLEIWNTSKLPDLYDQVLSHVQASDESRREAEHKLLLYRLNILKALPNPLAKLVGPQGTAAKSSTAAEEEARDLEKKKEALQTVQELANGIVSIDVADETAWSIVLDWQDKLHLSNLDRQKLRAYIHHFPRSGLSRSFEALLYTFKDAQFIQEQKKRQEEGDMEVRQSDPLSLALDGLEQSPDSLLSHRIAASLYLVDRDWSSCSDVSTAALSVARQMEAKYGLSFENGVKPSIEAILSISLTFIHPPQNHARALRLCERVQLKDESSVEALMAKGSILQSTSKWQQAREVYCTLLNQDERAKQDSTYEASRSLSVCVNPSREARLEIAWCDVQLGNLEEAEKELREVIEELDSDKDSNVQDQAKGWWRLGQCLWQMGGKHRSDRNEAFSCFINALKKDAGYAPAFTSLGLFYSTISEPKDMARASKCFQKAFELDAKEDEAAHRLAEMYAEEEDWDLVELVARRTIEAEGGSWIFQKQSQNTVTSTAQRRHITKNAWAWSAIGSTELVRENYEKAIISFQVALRSFPNSQHIWMRLGDAYAASGRQSAAIKTYERARRLQTDEDAWQAIFSIANVQRQLGMFEEALDCYQLVTKERPDLLQVYIALAETKISLSLQQKREGFVYRAAKGFRSATVTAILVLQKNEDFSAAWKVIADAFFHLGSMEREAIDLSFLLKVLPRILALEEKLSTDKKLPAVDSVSREKVRSSIPSKDHCTFAELTSAFKLTSAFLCKLRVPLTEIDKELAGSYWIDLAVALFDLVKDVRQCIESSDGEEDQVHSSLTYSHEYSKQVQSQAIACAKEALKLEPGNGLYWRILGNLVFDYGIPLAQHCFIKSIESDNKDPIPWTDLGFLLLANDDIELAHQAFIRAQTYDSDYVQAWIGKALVSERNEKADNARALYRHAYTIDQSGELESMYGFAISSFKYMQKSKNVSTALMNDAFTALSSYLSQRPYDVSALHLSALFAEQIGENDIASERILAAASILERQYEREESVEKAELFAICRANLGRIQLSLGDYDGAIESMEMCLGLLEESNDDKDIGTNTDPHKIQVSSDDINRARLNAHLTIGLSHYGKGDAIMAIESLQQALEDLIESRQDTIELQSAKGTLTNLIAQISWLEGKQEDAETILMEHLAENPQSLDVILTLGTISWLTGNQDQLEAVSSDLQSSMEAPSMSKTDLNRITSFLTLIDLYNGNNDRALERLRNTTNRNSIVELIIRIAAFEQLENGIPNEALLQNALKESRELLQSITQADEEDDGNSITKAIQSHCIVKLLSSEKIMTEEEQSSSEQRGKTSISLALQTIYSESDDLSSLKLLRDAVLLS